MMTQKKVLIILGMHRSGTSLITNWLNKCGLQIGERLQEASPSNVEGHFEDLEFKMIHEDILISNQLPSSGLTDCNDIKISTYQLEKLKAVINVKNNLHHQWGWKDPRTCLFLDTYLRLLPESKYLVILRNYQSVINSLLKRDFSQYDDVYLTRNFFSRLNWKYRQRKRRLNRFYHKNAERYLTIWLSYNEQILKMLKRLPAEKYLVIDYMVLQQGDKKIFDFLTSMWGLSMTYCNFMDVYKPSLMSTSQNIDDYISDKVLIDKAGYIETKLRSLIKDDQTVAHQP